MSFLFPAITLLPFITEETPWPTVILKYSHLYILFENFSLYEFTIAFPIGCSEKASAAQAYEKISLSENSLSTLLYSITLSFPLVSVPVLSKATVSTFDNLSSASPSLTKNPCLVALPMAAIMAIGVASTNAHGQNTTSIVTALIICPVKSHVSAAADNATTTIHVAHLSAVPTIFALPASADCTSFIILCIELSSPTLVALISNTPN